MKDTAFLLTLPDSMNLLLPAYEHQQNFYLHLHNIMVRKFLKGLILLSETLIPSLSPLNFHSKHKGQRPKPEQEDQKIKIDYKGLFCLIPCATIPKAIFFAFTLIISMKPS